MRVPHVGSIVCVLVDIRHNDGLDVAAAVVTRAHADYLVNVRVFFDGRTPDMDRLSMVQLYDDETRARQAIAYRERTAGQYGITFPTYAAFWPPSDLEKP